jgi:uncharacterized protein DUF4145
MAETEGSADVIEFMSLYHKLRNIAEPNFLEPLAATDEVVCGMCQKLFSVGQRLRSAELKSRRRFIAPVNPAFIGVWRDYEMRYSEPIERVFWISTERELKAKGFSLASRDNAHSQGLSPIDRMWKQADEEGEGLADTIEAMFESMESEDPESVFLAMCNERHLHSLQEPIEDAIYEWRQLGFDLRGAFRRRQLVPFVLIPRHVSQQHGEGEKLSFFAVLQQAQDAFVFGIPFAAVALMRSVLEVILREHYRADGSDLADVINNVRSLPRGLLPEHLHRLRKLANDILHSNDQAALPLDLERRLQVHLFHLRLLIEGAPSGR